MKPEPDLFNFASYLFIELTLSLSVGSATVSTALDNTTVPKRPCPPHPTRHTKTVCVSDMYKERERWEEKKIDYGNS